jgi:hypothetical protein
MLRGAQHDKVSEKKMLETINMIQKKGDRKKEGRKEMVRVTPARIYSAYDFIAILYAGLFISQGEKIKNLKNY